MLTFTALAAPGVAEDLSRDAELFHAALAFEVPLEGGVPRHWSSKRPETVSLDHETVHSGESAGRIVRDDGSEEAFSSLTTSIPVDFAGTIVELRGFVRTERVSDYAGLWLRTDSLTGPLEFDSMHRHKLGGTTDWTEYRIQVRLTPEARKLAFGVILSGTGTAWGDDLKLFVDGEPICEAPKVVRELSILELDGEFDDGSGVTTDTLSVTQVENLAVLGKVWGFLKYHHPRIARGELHWDYELFRILPGILQAADSSQRNEALLEWGLRIGKPTKCGICATLPENPQIAPDVDWIRETGLLGDDLSEYLRDVYRNRFAEGSQFYVTTDPPTSPHPVFTNELPYWKVELDAGYRLLGLFRFWNMVEYWFAYRDVIGEPWGDVLTDLLPVIAKAKTLDDYTLAVHRLNARVNDTHVDLYGNEKMLPPRGKCQLPVDLRFVEEQAVVAAYNNEVKGPASGLQPGDVLLEIDGIPVTRLVDDSRSWYSASNEPARLRKMARNLTRGECGPVKLRVLRGRKKMRATATRLPLKEVDRFAFYVQDRPGDTFQWLTDDTAYLKLTTLSRNEVPDYIQQAQDARGLIVDLRGYPKEFVVFTLGGHLVSEPVTFASFTEPDLDNPGAFNWLYRPSLEPAAPRYAGKVAVIVNELTQSQAEYTAMALRATPNALIVGSTTAGADGTLTKITLPGGLGTGFTGIGVFYPDGSPTQRVGIVPDVFVTPTAEGIRDGRDEVLERALYEVGGTPDRQAVQEAARSR